jgi:hypothetical protein
MKKRNMFMYHLVAITFTFTQLSAALFPSPSRRQITNFTSAGNPILADGSIYSADPAPIVVDGKVYILSGRDEAGATVNSFIMNEWQVFEALDPSPSPSGGNWILHQNIGRPQSIFAWAKAGTAYASQIVMGVDGRFYLYAPVTQAKGNNSDPFAIGVAVSRSPLGPFVDASPSGPIISQSVPRPGNRLQNIDPTVLVDTNGEVFIYLGTFGQLRGYQLERDMVTIKGPVTTVNTLTGFFEAPWLMKRGDIYYMLYAANNAAPNSPCTPTSYHACIAYGTASSPLGPWTFRGIVLSIVSSTTSHPGVYELNGTWFLTYHTRDGNNGGHFRRSIAFDIIDWDDSQSPPTMKVNQTWRANPPRHPSRNIAISAMPYSINSTPIQYWIKSINDERIERNPLPPDYWSSYAAAQSPETSILHYKWETAVQLNAVQMVFFADQPAGSNIGVAPPASWFVEYLDTTDTWTAVILANSSVYHTAVTNSPAEVRFQLVNTTSLRATLKASGRNGQFAGVAVKEWMALVPLAI